MSIADVIVKRSGGDRRDTIIEFGRDNDDIYSSASRRALGGDLRDDMTSEVELV